MSRPDIGLSTHIEDVVNMILAKDRGWPVLQLMADHNPQRSAPEAQVEMLDRIARGN